MEIWKAIPSFDGRYEVSNLGNARSMPRIDERGLMRKQRDLKQSVTKDGYLKIHTFVNKKPKHFFAHRLIYETFYEPIPPNMTINHKNGIRDDNRPENLEVLSHADNILYSKNVLGTRYDTYGSLRMTDAEYFHIHDLRLQGLKHREIAALVGFSKSQVSNVLNGAHVRKVIRPT